MGASKPEKTSLIYILPALGLGGVEVGLSNSYRKLSNSFNLEVVTLDRRVEKIQKIPSRMMGLRSLLWIFSQRKSAIIVTSLWRAHIFGLICRLFGFSWIAFFHNPCFGHILDRSVCRLSARFAAYCFFDCNQTRIAFHGKSMTRQSSIVPFVFWNTLASGRSGNMQDRDLDLVFVGRFSRVKRLDLCFALARLCISATPEFRIAFVGHGELTADVCAFCAEFPANVFHLGLLDSKGVRGVFRRSKMVICLSDHEGMAMAVVEGIQEGCVPVVRRVGEIAHYADVHSAIICDESLSLESVAERINAIRLDRAILESMNRNAISKLAIYPDYGDAFIAGVNSFLANRLDG